MIEHLVLFKVRSEVSDEDRNKMIAALHSLRRSVPAIRELSCGGNFSDRNEGFTHGLRVLFGSREDLQSYVSHPSHQKVVSECIRPIVERLIVVDYES